jgi:hypothetical protein
MRSGHTATVTYGLEQLKTGEFPQVSAIYKQNATPDAERAEPPMTEAALTNAFEPGLQALLDGLATRLNVR